MEFQKRQNDSCALNPGSLGLGLVTRIRVADAGGRKFQGGLSTLWQLGVNECLGGALCFEYPHFS